MAAAQERMQAATWTAMVSRAYDHARPAVRFGDLTWTGRELLDRAVARPTGWTPSAWNPANRCPHWSPPPPTPSRW